MTPREALETVLDQPHAQAVIDHRQRLRKPMTAYAAELLAKRLAECPNANEAADMMIEKGWQSISSAWIKPKEQVKVPTFQASHHITIPKPDDISPEERKRVGTKMIAFGKALDTVMREAREKANDERRARLRKRHEIVLAQDPRPLHQRLNLWTAGDDNEARDD